MGSLVGVSTQELIEILARENAKRRKTSQTFTYLFGGLMAGLLLLLLFLKVVRHQEVDFSMFASLTGLIGIGAAFSSTHRSALKEAAKLQSREAAGFLLEAYITSDEGGIIKICREALPGALSAVESPDDFDAYQRGLMNKMLVTRYPIQVVAASLECIGRVSGREAIPALERFQAAAAKDRRPEWQRLGQRALQILPDVRMRVAREIIDQRTNEVAAGHSAQLTRIEPDSNVELNA